MEDIEELKVTYKLKGGRTDKALDKKIKEFFIKSFGLAWEGQGYDFTTQERDIGFYKEERG